MQQQEYEACNKRDSLSSRTCKERLLRQLSRLVSSVTAKFSALRSSREAPIISLSRAELACKRNVRDTYVLLCFSDNGYAKLQSDERRARRSFDHVTHKPA